MVEVVLVSLGVETGEVDSSRVITWQIQPRAGDRPLGVVGEKSTRTE